MPLHQCALLPGGYLRNDQRRFVSTNFRAQRFNLRARNAAGLADLFGFCESSLRVGEFGFALFDLGLSAFECETRQLRIKT